MSDTKWLDDALMPLMKGRTATTANHIRFDSKEARDKAVAEITEQLAAPKPT